MCIRDSPPPAARGRDRPAGPGPQPLARHRRAPRRAVLGRGAPAEAGRGAPARALPPRRGSVRGLTSGTRRTLAAAVLLVVGLAASAAAAPAPRLLAGATSVVVNLPDDTPLGGYGGFPRRAWLPDLLGRYPDTFWFRPSTCLLYTSDAADERSSVDLGGRRIIKKKKKK